jgi:hypothetical protein
METPVSSLALGVETSPDLGQVVGRGVEVGKPTGSA